MVKDEGKIPEEDQSTPRPISKLWKNKWFKITGLGMAGLLGVVWYVAVIYKP